MAITGSRDAVREGFEKGLVKDGEGWMEMIISRNHSSDTYNQATADSITEKITGTYIDIFRDIQKRMQDLAEI